MNAEGETVVIRHSRVEGLTPDELYAKAAGARQGLAELARRWEGMGREMRRPRARAISRSALRCWRARAGPRVRGSSLRGRRPMGRWIRWRRARAGCWWVWRRKRRAQRESRETGFRSTWLAKPGFLSSARIHPRERDQQADREGQPDHGPVLGGVEPVSDAQPVPGMRDEQGDDHDQQAADPLERLDLITSERGIAHGPRSLESARASRVANW